MFLLSLQLKDKEKISLTPVQRELKYQNRVGRIEDELSGAQQRCDIYLHFPFTSVCDEKGKETKNNSAGTASRHEPLMNADARQ